MHPFEGKYKESNNSDSGEPLDIYEVIALAKRLNMTLDDLKEMSFVSLVNILLSSVENKEQKATQDDIDKFLM